MRTRVDGSTFACDICLLLDDLEMNGRPWLIIMYAESGRLTPLKVYCRLAESHLIAVSKSA